MLRASSKLLKQFPNGTLNMSRHPQLSRQQLTDLLDHAFSELEAWDKLIDEAVDKGFHPDTIQVTGPFLFGQLNMRVKALIEHLSEYK